MKPIILFLSILLLVNGNDFAQVVMQKKQSVKPVVQSVSIKKSSVFAGKMQDSLNQNTNTKVDSAKATLHEVSFTVVTAASDVQEPETNKAANTHWSCAIFDQDNRQVASFQDNGNADEYISGSQTPVLRMTTDNTAAFGDFSKGGRLHISINPNGNDTWVMSEFDLTLDFTGPKFTNHLKWSGIRVTQDNRETDLYFNRQADTAPHYDLKANKKM